MNKIYKIKRSGFFKSITTLASGSLIAQMITILVSPITTRIFTPEELGIYTLLTTAIGMFGPVICGRFDLSIVIEKDEKNVYALFKLSTILTIFFSIIVSIGYYIYLSMNNTYNSFKYAIIILFILLITTGLTNALTSYNNREKQYKLMTSVYVIRTCAQNFLMVLLGILKTGVVGLLISQVVSQFLGIKKQGEELIKKRKRIANITKDEMLFVAKKYKKQLIYSTPASFANSFSYSSINIFINSLFGASLLGYYSISYRALGLPLTVISNNVSKVFFEDASKEYNTNNNFQKSLRKTTIFLLIIAILMVISLEILSPLLFELVFGEGWKQAGIYVQILAPMFGIRFVVTGVSTGLIIAQRQDYEFLIQSMFIISSILIFLFVKSMNFSIYVYLVLISLIYSSIYVLFYIYIYLCSTGKFIKRI